MRIRREVFEKQKKARTSGVGEGGGRSDNNNNMGDFYHAETERSFTSVGSLDDDDSKFDPTIYLKVSSVLLVRAGMFLSQVSSIPSSNIQILIFQNILDMAVNTVIYSLIGFLFSYGKDYGSFIGFDHFIHDESNRNQFAEGWLIVIAASGLLVTAIGDRISFFASLLMNALISGFVFPLIIHWTLTDYGWMRVHTFSKVRVSYKDYSYSCLVHMSGGFLAFISLLILNKRLLRFKDMDVSSIPDNGPSLTLFGNFFLLIGFLGLGIPTKRYFLKHLNYNFYGIVLVNTLLSAFGAVTTTLLLTFTCPCEPMHKWTSMRSIQAGISGIAVIAGGADVYYPVAALAIGLCNGLIFSLVSFLVNVSPIEDYSNLIACHFVSGFLGTLLPPILGIREGFGVSAYYSFMHFSWQLLCDLAIIGFIGIIFLPVLLLLDYCSILRSWDEDINHRRAMFASKYIKHESGMNGVVEQPTEPNVNYGDGGYQTKELTTDQLPPSEPVNQERVDVLFEKKLSPSGGPEENSETLTADFFIACTTSKEGKDAFSSRKAKEENDRKYLVNYMVNTQPMTFFEEVRRGESRTPTQSAIIKGCGDGKNSRFFDIKVIKGIRHISDSKLFQKFRDNLTTPKRRTVWERERELRLGSVSNIWVPYRVGMETQV